MLVKKLKLLIADDHRLFIEGLRFLLKEEFDLDLLAYAVNGKDVIDKCNQEEFDLILMDINMPIINGIDTTRQIKSTHPSIKIIVLSMLNDLPTINKALEAGADGFILKNVGIDELLESFKSVFKNEIYISKSLLPYFTRDSVNILKTKSQYIQFSENIITPREQSVLKLIVEGFTNQQIADTLFISVKTADTHRKNMLAKLNLSNTALLVKFAIDNKLV